MENYEDTGEPDKKPEKGTKTYGMYMRQMYVLERRQNQTQAALGGIEMLINMYRK